MTERRLHSRRRIAHQFAQLHSAAQAIEHDLGALHGILHHTLHMVDKLMADTKDLDAKIAELAQFVEDDERQDDETEAALNAVITDLRAQIAAGTVDLQPQIAALEAIKSKLHTPPPSA